MADSDSRFLELPDDAADASRALYEAGYTDGLPVIAPTPERVARMMEADPRGAQATIGRVPPRLGSATIEAMAVNAVMAGARPESFPVIVAAMEAMLAPTFNLLGVQATTHPCTPVLLVNGPIRHALGMATGVNALGEGNQASVTIGRAVRLILRNVGGAIPGTTDMVTHGTPARLGFVFAENEEASPFPPLHVALGFDKTDSVVFAMAGEGPHNVNDHSSQTAKSVLMMIAGTVGASGSNDLGRGGKPLVLLGPEHAAIIARDGLGRRDVQEFLWTHARFPLERLPEDFREWLGERKDLDKTLWNERGIPVANRPEDIYVAVAGGKGRHSVYVPSFGFTKPSWKKIPFDGSHVKYTQKPECDC